MNDQSIQRVQTIYGIENWSGGYFDVNKSGNITARPSANDPRTVDLKHLVDYLVNEKKMKLPLLLRFPQILSNQLKILTSAYQEAIAQFEYKAKHFPVFPMKVNPRREVVEEFLKESGRLRVGLECGSKAELYAAVAQEQVPETLLICNGFKDEAFCRLACLAVQAGKRVIIVIEKLNELKMLLRVVSQTGVCPWIGLRVKLYTRGSGKWASSGGDSAKFGLTTSEIMQSVKLLRESKMEHQFKLLHFHIGSQITSAGPYVDAVDKNYTVQEFANDVVYSILSVCDEEGVPHPSLVTESGRMMTAYHSVLIVSIREEIETFADDQPEVEIDSDDPQVITELKWLCDDINGKNYLEYYHDAIEHKDELHTQFNLGLISLEDRAKGEVLYWEVCARALKESESARIPNEEFEEVKRVLAAKYLCNFSLFRSAPDSWAIGQLFPIVPIHRLDEAKLDFATLVDVTCDSDGKIDKFVDLKDVKETLELPEWRENEDYYVGLFLVGAYQEVMGSFHNLFGLPNEAQVFLVDDGQFHVSKLIAGSHIEDMVRFAQYEAASLQQAFAKKVNQQVALGVLKQGECDQMVKEYIDAARWSTYLE